MPLSHFHPLVQEWFRGRFTEPTDAQLQGWPAIAQGRHTLIAAPTGSGKTLAAFLTCIDSLVRQGLTGEIPDSTQVVYVSPLKALSNDIQKNLAKPLEEIAALAEAAGTPLPEIRAGVRTGDTRASEWAKMAKRPPHILITTPESLYILLTSKSGRQGLTGVHTLILDEIHAVAGSKRGSHLSLSVERLCALAENPVVRIGLSATQRPIEEVARLLVGNDCIERDGEENGTPDCLMVNTGHARTIDLAMRLPQRELGPIASHEMWAEALDDVTGLIRSHGTTLVFVNTRRLVERVSHQLSERLGEDAVVAHHGSLSRTTRLAAEEKLKSGLVKVCVATASLELGIDIGVVDLVCQIGSPRSIGVLLQRVGRSGHQVGGIPKGRLFPLTRDELAECVALARAVKQGNLDTLIIPPWPLDVLAQQIVASCAQEEWTEEQLYQLCHKAYPYRDLPREKFDQVVDVLSNGFTLRQGRRSAYLHRDGINLKVKGRRGASIAAMTSGGAIPDNADYDVILEPEETFVGTVNEDFAIESLPGDVFLLGNTPWKIRRVERGKVRVEDAQGQPPSVPFWLGEAPGRTWELSQEVSELREGIDLRLENHAKAQEWVIEESGVDQESSRQLVAYLVEGKRVLGVIPSKNKVVAERFFDESGGMQLVIHAPYGARVNRAWGMALRKKICRTFDFELQATATDDGLNFALGPGLSMPVDEVFTYLNERSIQGVLEQAILQAPLFGTRWRWNATRALAILRHTGGRKVPAPLIRMRSEDLLAAVFPAQVACQDNAMPGDIEVPDHPLVFETMRDCLTEAMDVAGCKELLGGISDGTIEIFGRDTVQPSAFSHQILNAMPYAFLDDAPLEERRARSVSLRRALPEDSRDLSALDPSAIALETANAWPRMRDADELHDALLVLGALPESTALTSAAEDGMGAIQQWFDSLVAVGRAYYLRSDDVVHWVAAERLSLLNPIFPNADITPTPPRNLLEADISEGDGAREDNIHSVLQGWVECSGPLTTTEVVQSLGIPRDDIQYAFGRLENEGVVLRGTFRIEVEEEEFCDRRILARIHRSTIDTLRREVEPVPPSTFMRFLLRWQHVDSAAKLQGEGGLLIAIEQLQGFESAGGAIEEEVLLSRVSDYSPAMLDRLCLGGEVVWGRVSLQQTGQSQQQNPQQQNGATMPKGRGSLSRATPITLVLRDSLDWVLGPNEQDADNLTGAAKEVVEVLGGRGASFLSDIVSATQRLPSDVEEALWTLAASGRVTVDGVEALRQRLGGTIRRPRRNGRNSGRSGQIRRRSYSRWSLLEASDPVDDRSEPIARQLLDRYGVIFPELLARDALSYRWRDLVRVLRRLEARGEIRGGRFVSGLVGEQFALPEAVELLRKTKNTQPDGRLSAISACDPLNLAGIISPGPKVPAVVRNRLAFHDGVPVASIENGSFVQLANVSSEIIERAKVVLSVPISHAGYPMDQPDLATV
ncbi:MAG: DEAD/DEAH box helicase [Chloroflexi bacterium]|nr:DEAD/DEAH box helicase [Chloroflexota bacterium]